MMIARVVPICLALTVALLAQSTSATVAGRVVSADTGRGIPNARVGWGEDGSDAIRTVMTGADGAFAIAIARPGRYLLRASAAGYKSTAYGEDPNLNREATLVSVSASPAKAELRLTMHRGGTIAGVVTNDLKEPVIDTEVRALGEWSRNGDSRMVFFSSAKTDDRGAYRLIGLEAGDYTVGVVDGLSMAFASSPRTPAARRTIAVGPDAEISGVNIQTKPSPAGSIAGQLAGPGAGVPGLEVRVFPDPDPAGIWPVTTVRSEAGAHFSLADVPAGRYALIVRPGISTAQPRAWGRANVIVTAGAEATPVITLHAGARISGSVTSVQSPRGAIEIDPIGPDHPEARLTSAPIAGDGTFTITNVAPGRYRWVPNQQLTWSRRYLLSAFVKNQDVTDLPFDVGPDVAIEDVRVTVTAGGRISGTMLGLDGKPTTAGGVVIASLDPRDWTRVSRRVRLERPDTAGYFEAAQLPPGRYSVSLATRLAPGQLWDPAFLKTLSKSLQITLADGQSETVQLRLK